MIHQQVTKSFGFLKTTAIGGLIFLLPLIVIGALIGQVVPLVMSVVKAVGGWLPDWLKSAGGIALLVLLAIGVILLLCFAAGLLARRSFAQRLGAFIEKQLTLLFPRYAIIREQMTGKFGGEETEARLKPVVVRFDDMSRFGFETERTDQGLVAVFLPGAPDPWAGHVVLVTADRVSPLAISFRDAVEVAEQLGRGSSTILQSVAKDPESTTASNVESVSVQATHNA